jgi:hypothetical protein
MAEDGWFYAEGERPIGPVTCDALVALLRNTSDPGKVKVWRTSSLTGKTRRTYRKSLIRFLGRRLFQASGSKELRSLFGKLSLPRRKTKRRAPRKPR